jgi:hypothetical protein
MSPVRSEDTEGGQPSRGRHASLGSSKVVRHAPLEATSRWRAHGVLISFRGGSGGTGARPLLGVAATSAWSDESRAGLGRDVSVRSDHETAILPG